MTRRHGALPRTILLAGDLGAALAAFMIAYVLRFHAGLRAVLGRTDELPARYLEAAPVVVLICLGAVAWAGLYRRDQFSRSIPWREGARVGVATAAALGTLALLYWKEFQYSRLTIAFTAGLFGLLFLVGRALTTRIVLRMRRSGRFRTPVSLVGGGAVAQQLLRGVLQDAWMGLDLVSVLPIGDPPLVTEAPHVTLEELLEQLTGGTVEEVFLAVPGAEGERLGELLDALTQVTANVRVIPDLGGAKLLHPDASVVGGVPLISVRESPLYGPRAVLKRLLDLLISALLLVALSPLLAAIAVLVKLSSSGPVLYAQERMGLDGARFRMWKFRTMSANAEQDSGPIFATKDDTRTTTVGRWLRRLSADEIPQLWNVIRGDMSLVGPRPERPQFIEEFRNLFPGYMLRHSVRAGVTGWAQVHGLRGDTSLPERLRFDLEYIDRWSLLLDFEILCRTAVQVVVGRNAY